MNERQLSKRLLHVARFLTEARVLADIGSDHAYLPCYLCLQQKEMRAVAGELNKGPYESAKAQVERLGLEEAIEVRRGNGLEVVCEGEAFDAVAIAGMGGPLIATILEEGKSKLTTVKRLVLQPNVAANAIRTWLRLNDWALVAEEILEEDGKVYEILVAERGDADSLYREEAEKKVLFGPILLKEHNEAFQKKWSHELANWEKVLTQLERAATSSETEARKAKLLEKIKLAREVLF
ncbi:tRNA (adenine(22)-N(1))-methyltransferase [Shouchella shacheensis]|uniref:tRNA (adenine(22)-N(1))-methyltransferase n=1 Tax=Shouchella shacheensis TaxID=1649580 RepID=UPI00073FF1F9|nr:tRNA (adenine(22)-N(1))-methyltransferase TrmK [Shouchella shacheensis]